MREIRLARARPEETGPWRAVPNRIASRDLDVDGFRPVKRTGISVCGARRGDGGEKNDVQLHFPWVVGGAVMYWEYAKSKGPHNRRKTTTRKSISMYERMRRRKTKARDNDINSLELDLTYNVVYEFLTC